EVLEARLAARHLAAGLDARRVLTRLLPAVMLDEAAFLQHEIDLLVQSPSRSLLRQALDQSMEAAQGARGPAALLRVAAGCRCRPQRGAGPARLVTQSLDGPLTDAARRQVHDPLIGRVVVSIHQQSQITQRVLDLRALEESQAAIDLVGNAPGDERFLERA